MRIVDTVVLIALRDRNDPFFKKANEHVIEIGLSRDILVPSATLMEFDLELKSHGESSESRADIHSTVAGLVPPGKVLSLTPGVLRRAAELSETATWRGSYFDTLIAASGLEFGANEVITTDRKFAKLGIEPVF
ncbi:MAG: type II toxin-antitoxin system VapC family toxin [Nitrososphaerota archaeon]|nr:type II toxin-antitoxin system VapC family toxin [Nitrososphaerota archaeon]